MAMSCTWKRIIGSRREHSRIHHENVEWVGATFQWKRVTCESSEVPHTSWHVVIQPQSDPAPHFPHYDCINREHVPQWTNFSHSKQKRRVLSCSWPSKGLSPVITCIITRSLNICYRLSLSLYRYGFAWAPDLLLFSYPFPNTLAFLAAPSGINAHSMSMISNYAHTFYCWVNYVLFQLKVE